MTSTRKKTGYLGDHPLNKNSPRSSLKKLVSRVTHQYFTLKQFEKMSAKDIRKLNPDTISSNLNDEIAKPGNKLKEPQKTALIDLLAFKRERNVMSNAMKSDGKSKVDIASYRERSVSKRKGGKRKTERRKKRK